MLPVTLVDGSAGAAPLSVVTSLERDHTVLIGTYTGMFMFPWPFFPGSHDRHRPTDLPPSRAAEPPNREVQPHLVPVGVARVGVSADRAV
jgi:hypothetical protein